MNEKVIESKNTKKITGDVLTVLLEQYKVFNELRFHYSKLAWQMPAAFLGILAIFANVLKDSNKMPDFYLSYLLVVLGILILLIAISTKRHIDNENYYTNRFKEVSKLLSDKSPYSSIVEHRTKISSRRLLLFFLFSIGFLLVMGGVINAYI
jgi:hypothetical protein